MAYPASSGGRDQLLTGRRESAFVFCGFVEDGLAVYRANPAFVPAPIAVVPAAGGRCPGADAAVLAELEGLRL